MYTDTDIQRDVTAELKWEPGLQDDDIAVGVREGLVTLGGFVNSFADRRKAERVAARVKGVKAIVNDVEVKLPSFFERADPALARAALEHLKWASGVPAEKIRVKVDKGWLTLEGEVDWEYQKSAAEKAIRDLVGMKGASNLITVRPQPVPRDVQKRIREALHRAAQFDADRIRVEVDGNKVTLEGTVRSYAELRDAERAARAAPGVTEVISRLEIVSAFAEA